MRAHRWFLAPLVAGLSLFSASPAHAGGERAWSDCSASLLAETEAEYVTGVRVDRLDGTVYMGALGHGIWSSDDVCATWTRVEAADVGGRLETGWSLDQDQEAPRRLAFFGLDPADAGSGLTGYSPDGDTWTLWSTDDVGYGRHWDFGSVDWSSADAGTVVAVLHETGNPRLLLTTDGETWTRRDIPWGADPGDLGMVGALGPGVFVIATPSGALSRSTDLGASWGAVGGEAADATVRTHVPVYFDGRHYLGTTQGLAVSDDAGQTWAFQGSNAISIDQGPFFGGDASSMVVVNAEGLHRSDDAGESWSWIAPLAENAFAGGFGDFGQPHRWAQYAWDPVHNNAYASTMSQPGLMLDLGPGEGPSPGGTTGTGTGMGTSGGDGESGDFTTADSPASTSGTGGMGSPTSGPAPTGDAGGAEGAETEGETDGASAGDGGAGCRVGRGAPGGLWLFGLLTLARVRRRRPRRWLSGLGFVAVSCAAASPGGEDGTDSSSSTRGDEAGGGSAADAGVTSSSDVGTASSGVDTSPGGTDGDAGSSTSGTSSSDDDTGPGVVHECEALAGGRCWYVSHDGDDDADGSVSAPLLHIHAAVAAAEPGDAIYVREGIWNRETSDVAAFCGDGNVRSTVISLTGSNLGSLYGPGCEHYARYEAASGTEDRPILLAAYHGETVVLDGQVELDLDGGELTDPECAAGPGRAQLPNAIRIGQVGESISHWTIRGFDIVGGMVNLRSGEVSNIILEGNTFQGGVVCAGHNPGYVKMYYEDGDAPHHVTIRDNTFRDLREDGPGIADWQDTQTLGRIGAVTMLSGLNYGDSGVVHDVRVLDNEFYDLTAPFYVPWPGTHTVEISGNTFANSMEMGPFDVAPGAFTFTDNVVEVESCGNLC